MDGYSRATDINSKFSILFVWNRLIRRALVGNGPLPISWSIEFHYYFCSGREIRERFYFYFNPGVWESPMVHILCSGYGAFWKSAEYFFHCYLRYKQLEESTSLDTSETLAFICCQWDTEGQAAKGQLLGSNFGEFEWFCSYSHGEKCRNNRIITNQI